MSSDHHLVPVSSYLKVFSALMILTVITVVAARFEFGFMNTVIAMVIATIKAFLVLAIFMHLKYDNLMNRAAFGVGFFLLLILFGFTIIDIYTRFDDVPK